MISKVAASEMERAQTEHMSSPEALCARGRGIRSDDFPESSGSYKSVKSSKRLERRTIEGDSPVGQT